MPTSAAPLAASTWGRWPTLLPGPLQGASLAGVNLLPEALGTGARLVVEIAWSGTPTTAPEGWGWVDVTTDVRQAPGIDTALGRGDEASTSQPADCTLVLGNGSGAYSLGGQSSNWPNVRRGTPVRVRVDPGDGGGFRVVFLGFANGFTPGWDSINGDIPVVTLSASGTLRRLAQGSAPLVSAYRRSMTDTASVVAYWPMEEEQGSTYAPAVRGGNPMVGPGVSTMTWEASSAFESSDALPNMGTAQLQAVVTPYTQTLENQVRFFVIIPSTALVDGTVLAYVYTTGTMYRWDIVYSSAGTGNLSLYRYNNDGTLNSSTVNVTFDMNGNRRRLALRMTQNGANVDWRLEVLDADPGDPGGGISGTIVGKTVGIVSQVVLAPGAGCNGVTMGHLTVQNDVTSTFEAAQAFWAWQRAAGALSTGETPTGGTGRLVRLCSENDIPLSRYTGSGTAPGDATVPNYETMGAQRGRSLLDLIRQCELADQGQVWDGRSAGLSVTTRRYREEGNQRLVIDAGAGQLAPPFAPVDDDQRTRNRVTVSRDGGVTATAEQSTGANGTARIGVYDTAVSYAGSSDAFTAQLAAFLVSLGTVEGYRYPTVTLRARSTPTLMARALDLVPGDRVSIVNIPTALLSFPVGDVELIVEGIAHSIDASDWVITLRCSLGSPWFAAEVPAESGDTAEFLFRADTDGATLAGDLAAGATSILVATPSGPLWTTVADDYPLALSVGGIEVTASACTGSTSPQTFTISPVTLPRTGGSPVQLFDQAPLAL